VTPHRQVVTEVVTDSRLWAATEVHEPGAGTQDRGPAGVEGIQGERAAIKTVGVQIPLACSEQDKPGPVLDDRLRRRRWSLF
jgi:hypothetical protein